MFTLVWAYGGGDDVRIQCNPELSDPTDTCKVVKNTLTLQVLQNILVFFACDGNIILKCRDRIHVFPCLVHVTFHSSCKKKPVICFKYTGGDNVSVINVLLNCE